MQDSHTDAGCLPGLFYLSSVSSLSFLYILGSSLQERHGAPGAGPGEGNKDD